MLAAGRRGWLKLNAREGGEMAQRESQGQSAEFLAELLAYLACPVDGSPLTAVRDAEGETVALQSKNGEYPVVNNVPNMMPPPDRSPDRTLRLWREGQERMWQNYEGGDEGVFSTEDEVTAYLGEILAQNTSGVFLDVGCGALPAPPYMAASKDHLRWFGIDPFFGNSARAFPFAQGMGEYLPFADGALDGALFCSTIYHQRDPGESLRRARQAVKPRGRLYVSFDAHRVNARYVLWRARQALGWPCRYDKSYRWAFTRESLGALLQGTGWVLEEEVLLCTRCPEYGTCENPAAWLVVGRPG
jgi:SAM-dependent methyltransferase